MEQKIAPELIRDFFKMLGPKLPQGLNDYSIELEPVSNNRNYFVFKFVLPEDVKTELLIGDKMLPMFASSLENLLFSYTVRHGWGGKYAEWYEFVENLDEFKKTIENYFKNVEVNTVYEFV